MKKSLLAVAVAGALPFVAHAQTNVTLYGIADAGVGYVKTDGLVPATATTAASRTTGAFQVGSGVQSSSRWGIRGTEDLGGGLAAIFNAEAGWNVDDGTAKIPAQQSFFNRVSTAGLQGAFGQVYVGRGYTPTFYVGAAGDIGGYGMWGTNLGYASANFASIRYSNAIFYNTPSWGGLQIRAAIGNNQQAGTEFDTSPKGRDRNFEIGALYAAGPISAGISGRIGNLATADAGGGTRRIKQVLASAGYNFGPARLVAELGGSWPDRTVNSLVSAGDINSTSSASAVTTGQQFYGNDRAIMGSLGVGIRAGAGEVLIQGWQVRMDAVATGSSFGTNGAKPKATFATLAYTYPLSTRTNLYASYGWGSNSNGANIPLIGSDTSAASTTSGAANNPNANARQQAITFGMRHMF